MPLDNAKMEKKDIDYFANLSMLILNESEKELFTKQLGSILDYMEKLNELDTRDVKHMVYASKFNNVFREDKITPSIVQQQALKNAPSCILPFFKVPKVIE